MTSLKNIFKNILIYKEPKKEHDFILPESTGTKHELEQDIKEKTLIYDNLDKNIEFIKIKFNSLINSDIILREFSITAKGKNCRALLIAIDGMVSSELINNYLLKPLMINENNNRSSRTDKVVRFYRITTK